MPKKTLSILSLGCFRNTYDSGVLLDDLLSKGYILNKANTKADLLVINTCGFIESAKKESIQEIAQAIKLKKKGYFKKIMVVGCLVKRYVDDLRKCLPEVDYWQGIIDFPKKRTPTSRRVLAKNKLIPGWLGFIKICEGCVNRCSYCAIPSIKGPLRSRLPCDIVKEVKALAKTGIKELNIIGQDITAWGKDLKGNHNLTYLLKKIIKVTGKISWVRLIYTHPKHITDDLLDLIAKEKKICKYIDLPIQHINDRILKLMNRRVSAKTICKLIDKIRGKIPGVTLRTSLIAGFPTERKKEFKELLGFVKSAHFDRVGAFAYSREEDTRAFSFKGQVHPATKERRFKELMLAQESIIEDINSRFLGKKLKVLVEAREDNIFVGRSQHDAFEADGVVYIKKNNLKLGSFVTVTITGAVGHDLIAE